MKTLGQIAYEGAASETGCKQLFSEANQPKWEASASAVRKAVLEMAIEEIRRLEAKFWDEMDADERAANECWNEAIENVTAKLQSLKEIDGDGVMPTSEQADKSVSAPPLQSDPGREAISSRRFGPAHEKPCADPAIITCAKYECQSQNRCRLIEDPTVEAPSSQTLEAE